MIEPFTKIRFTKDITDPACGDHPELLYAKAGETGTIWPGISFMGYFATSEKHHGLFGVSKDEFEVLKNNEDNCNQHCNQ